jgi:hypothetical protein
LAVLKPGDGWVAVSFVAAGFLGLIWHEPGRVELLVQEHILGRMLPVLLGIGLQHNKAGERQTETDDKVEVPLHCAASIQFRRCAAFSSYVLIRRTIPKWKGGTSYVIIPRFASGNS